MSESPKIELEVVVKAETDMALLLEDLEGEDVWLPLSQITIDDDPGDGHREGATLTVELPEWLAKKEGLI